MAVGTISGIEFEHGVQSTFRIKSGGVVIWIDPHRVTGGEKADLLLITHEHGDHLDVSSIDAVVKGETIIVANDPCARQIQGRGARVVGVRECQTVTERGITIRSVPGYNPFHPRVHQSIAGCQFNVGFIFTFAGQTIYHAGDTDLVPEMAQLGPMDIALLPIGGNYTMEEGEAAGVVRLIRPRVVVPMHYGVYTAGDPRRFKELVKDASQVEII